MIRDTIFISHSTPQDNEFSIWIASRLEMLGYNTWIDKEGLLGGERFWPTIQKAIEKSVKVIFVCSKNILTKDGVLKQGIEDEIEYAKSLASQYGFQDFVIPLHIDESPFNLAIGLPNIIQIPFNGNWAVGLIQLLKKLEKDAVPKKTININSTLSEWYENEYVSNCSIISKKELYYTSWWQVKEIPLQFYMYQFTNIAQAKAIRDLNKDIPISLQSNTLSSFEKELNLIVTRDGEQIEVIPERTFSFSLTDVLEGFESDKFPRHRDVENHYKRLLYCCIASNLFWQKWLKKHEMSNKRIAYYLPRYEWVKKTDFTYPFGIRKKSKSIIGKFENIGSWHYAISIQSILFPVVGFSISSHILFTSDGFKIINDDKKQHSYRRKKGKRFFNEDWRDLQLAFIQRLKDEDGKIKIKVSKSEEYDLEMKEWPEMFWSEVGFNDPNAKMDIDKVEAYIEELNEEESDD